MNVTAYRTLTDLLLSKKDSQKTLTFIEGENRRQAVPYSELLQRAMARLAHFQAQGLLPGSQLIIQTNNNLQFLEGFWACLLGGITAIPVSGGNSAEHRFKLFRIADKLQSPGLYTDTQTLGRLSSFAASHELQDDYAALSKTTLACDVAPPQLGKAAVHNAAETDTAFIQFSSGSTSTPKGVVLTHKNLVINTQSIIDGCLMDQNDHLLSWMPLTHDMGLIGFHLTPLLCDVNHSLMPTEVFVRRPGLWLTETQAASASILCSPNFGYQHVLKSFKPEKYPTLDLSCIRLLFNGAEPISVPLCQRFMSTMADFKLDQDAMYPVYGLAEASLAVTFPPLDKRFQTVAVDRAHMALGETVRLLDEDSDNSLRFVAVGQPVSNVSIMIADQSGEPQVDGVTGHICIRGDNVTAGYFKEPELNAATISEAGWLNTGDLGFVLDKQLYITGRAKDIIFVSGQNVYPHDLEEIVLQAGLVERGKLAIAGYRAHGAAEESLIVFVLHRQEASTLGDTAKAITRLLGEAAGVRVHSVVPVARIPKTTSGKIQRYLMVDDLAKGELSPLLQQQGSIDGTLDADSEHPGQGSDSPAAEGGKDADTQSLLLTICNTQVEDVELKVDDNLFELGISSLTLAQIHAAIEETWPDKVDITDLFDYPTVAELAQFLDESIAA